MNNNPAGGGTSFSGRCTTSGACYQSVLTGTIGPIDVVVIVVGVIILLGVVFSLARGAWTKVKIVVVVLVLIAGAIAIVWADNVVSSAVAQFTFNAPPPNRSTNQNVTVTGSVLFSGTVGFPDSTTESATGSAPVNSVVYSNGKYVASLSLRVDLSVACNVPCGVNITSGYTALAIQNATGGYAHAVRNVTYSPVAFPSSSSVNLWRQAWNGSQIETDALAGRGLACGVGDRFNLTVAGAFTMRVNAGGSVSNRSVSFAWPGFPLFGRPPVSCPSGPSAPFPTPSQNLLYYKFVGFGPAWVRSRRY